LARSDNHTLVIARSASDEAIPNTQGSSTRLRLSQ
jgi:hypothetical protein